MTRQLRVIAGPRTTQLRRPRSTQRKSEFTAEQLAAARAVMARGRQVVVQVPRLHRVRPRILLAVGLVPLGIAATDLAIGGSAFTEVFSVFLVIGAILVVTAVAGWVSPLGGDASEQAKKLGGRRVTGAARESIRLWQLAIAATERGDRSEDELPALFDRVIELVSAEDKVDRLLARGRYDPDQTDLLPARQQVERLAAEVEALLGIAPELPPPDYRTNRWAEFESTPAPAPANPDELR